uniref:Ig-like domain-containing protein n=1 Tax=Mola mola TaxID=94237 RepID=A0A3Q3VTE4_MOLML
MTAADRKRLENLIRKANSVLGCPLEPMEVVGGRWMTNTHTELQSTFSERLIHPNCVRERYRSSFLPAAVRLYNHVYSFQIGFIKRPRVSEIISSTSSHDQTLTLGCEITDFYPPKISVTWLKLREGEQDDREEEVIEGGEVATAALKRRATFQEKKERGGGIICRVEHSSLLDPIEKHWKSVDIGMNHSQPLSFYLLFIFILFLKLRLNQHHFFTAETSLLAYKTKLNKLKHLE